MLPRFGQQEHRVRRRHERHVHSLGSGLPAKAVITQYANDAVWRRSLRITSDTFPRSNRELPHGLASDGSGRAAIHAGSQRAVPTARSRPSPHRAPVHRRVGPAAVRHLAPQPGRRRRPTAARPRGHPVAHRPPRRLLRGVVARQGRRRVHRVRRHPVLPRRRLPDLRPEHPPPPGLAHLVLDQAAGAQRRLPPDARTSRSSRRSATASTPSRGSSTQGYRSDQITIAGDSAGGYLAFSVARAVMDQGWGRPAGIVAISPLLDFDDTRKRAAPNAHRCQTFPLHAVSRLSKVDHAPRHPPRRRRASGPAPSTCHWPTCRPRSSTSVPARC